MRSQRLAFTAPAGAPRWKRWLVFSPLARIAFFAAMTLLFSFALASVMTAANWGGRSNPPLERAAGQLLLRALPALMAYLILVFGVERRAPTELSLRSLVPHGAAGLVAGFTLFSAVVGLLWLLGSYHVTGTNAGAHWLPQLLVVGLGASIGEEIISRGALFRIVEEGLGTWAALIVSALFFGAAHLGNPGATVWSSAAIAIEAGLLFGMLYHVTRSLPVCMGAHAAWNFAQGVVYGIPVSGTRVDGWLVSRRTGPDWLSGGVFGAEASVVALVLCSLCTLTLLLFALRRGSLVPMRHGRRQPVTAAPL